MALSDPVSCLLCLDAYERVQMLAVHVRPLGHEGSRQIMICPKCGGAIAAEYLYLENAKKDGAENMRQAAKENLAEGSGDGDAAHVPAPRKSESEAAAGAELAVQNVTSEMESVPTTYGRGTKKGPKG